eukprot:TRINITY_DN1388_c1_g2_i2.p1 TRINITY_DN1388_c1_g2~~TRINITY_DN1388_c1_g2_i2.p1  ORF type:complete len:245 (+),score=55.63 TRINITY_DN1388_c1_g2_i2:87-821(+)
MNKRADTEINAPTNEEEVLMENDGNVVFCDVVKPLPIEEVAVEPEVVVIETVDPTVTHYWPACLGAFFCDLFGVAFTLMCCNSKYGKAGAATGMGINALKMIIISVLTITTGACYFLYHYDPTIITYEQCAQQGGVWGPHKPEPCPEYKGSRQALELQTTSHCSCLPNYKYVMTNYGARCVVKVDRSTWIMVLAFAAILFCSSMAIRAHYLSGASLTKAVAIPVGSQSQPGYPVGSEPVVGTIV